ncbi:MAG TPA: hypothetical protein VN730_00395, partial [Steroidobacteraceae bacterium]|nr:hypothetical protein [Steroidobacteraceae bacterium]
VPVVAAYKAAVAELAAKLTSGNVEAARVALRSLVGTVPVFVQEGRPYGRLGINPTPLFRDRNRGDVVLHGSGGRI